MKDLDLDLDLDFYLALDWFKSHFDLLPEEYSDDNLYDLSVVVRGDCDDEA